jgi:hypothetical protein
MDLSTFAPGIRILLLAGFMRLSTMGYFTPQQATDLTKLVMDLLTYGAPIAYAIWAIWKARPAARVAAAAALPEVGKIVTTDPTLGASASAAAPTMAASNKISAHWLVNAVAVFMAASWLSACITDSQIATADTKLRDKCAYLQSGVAIARLGAPFIPAAAPIVTIGADLIDDYCVGKPVTNLGDALAQMEKVIVAVRPIAAQLKK